MPNISQHNGQALSWLLEADSPGARYLALRDLADSPRAADLRAARKEAHEKGPIAAILRNMEDEGYWVRAGPGYNPKYRSAAWSILALAQLGASIEQDQRIGRASNARRGVTGQWSVLLQAVAEQFAQGGKGCRSHFRCVLSLSHLS